MGLPSQWGYTHRTGIETDAQQHIEVKPIYARGFDERKHAVFAETGYCIPQQSIVEVKRRYYR